MFTTSLGLLKKFEKNIAQFFFQINVMLNLPCDVHHLLLLLKIEKKHYMRKQILQLIDFTHFAFYYFQSFQIWFRAISC
jgi:hypothetical protein